MRFQLFTNDYNRLYDKQPSFIYELAIILKNRGEQ